MNVDAIKSLFDYNNGSLVWKISKPGVKKGSIAGYKKPDGYVQVIIDRKKYYAHRLVYVLFHDSCEGSIDHIDGNRSNNKIENLRLATQSQQLMNSVRKGNKTGVKGVYFESKTKKYRACITANGTSYKSKRFEFLADAAQWANDKRKELHGSYANYEVCV